MNRTTFIVDGFNLYHSVCDASRALGLAGSGVKWLNLSKLCESYLALVGGPAHLERIYYFSALATHLESAKPDLTLRHRAYLECLEDTGVVVELSRFKMKDIVCRQCGHKFQRAEEKETDVALAAKLLEVLHKDECDTAVLVTGDTDIAPAVRAASALFLSSEFASRFRSDAKTRSWRSLFLRPLESRRKLTGAINSQILSPSRAAKPSRSRPSGEAARRLTRFDRVVLKDLAASSPGSRQAGFRRATRRRASLRHGDSFQIVLKRSLSRLSREMDSHVCPSLSRPSSRKCKPLRRHAARSHFKS